MPSSGQPAAMGFGVTLADGLVFGDSPRLPGAPLPSHLFAVGAGPGLQFALADNAIAIQVLGAEPTLGLCRVEGTPFLPGRS